MKPSRTCEQLGLCQRRNPSCKGCTWPLAPNVVEGPFKRQRFAWFKRNQPRIVLWLLVAAQLGWFALLVGFALGYTGVLNG